jgi:hypothetical protein
MLDKVYDERNHLVALLARMYPSGLKRTAIENWDPEWHNCVYIEFPWGQASWHFHDRDAYLFQGLPEYHRQWDGHTTEQKYEAIRNGITTYQFFTVWTPHPKADGSGVPGAPNGKASGGEGFFGSGGANRQYQQRGLFDGNEGPERGRAGVTVRFLMWITAAFLLLDGVFGLVRLWGVP